METHTIGPEIRLGTLKRVENETETLFDVEYGEKTEKGGKWETHNVVHRKWWERVKNMKNEKNTL